MDRLPAPVDRSIGPALRELLDASPKAVRRALQDRRGAEGLDGGKRAKKEETRRLVSSLDALARFLTDFSALESSGDPATAHPVLDPLLERVVRPTAGRGSGASVARSSDRSTDEKKTALRLVAFLASPARTSLGERREDANDALLGHGRGSSAGQAVRTGTHRERETRRVRHETRRRTLPRAAAARAPRRRRVAGAIRESERTRLSEADPPTLAVAAVDAALAVTARTAIAAAEDGEDGDFDGAGESRARACAAVRGWWRAGSRAHSARGGAGRGRACVRHRRAVVRARGAGEGRHRRVPSAAVGWRAWRGGRRSSRRTASGLGEGPEPTPSAGEPRETRAVNGATLTTLISRPAPCVWRVGSRPPPPPPRMTPRASPAPATD